MPAPEDAGPVRGPPGNSVNVISEKDGKQVLYALLDNYFRRPAEEKDPDEGHQDLLDHNETHGALSSANRSQLPSRFKLFPLLPNAQH